MQAHPAIFHVHMKIHDIVLTMIEKFFKGIYDFCNTW